MAQCETCGNDYDKAFEVIMAGTSYTFDSFECAIQTLAPTCSHCGCRIIGHGVEADDTLYCCAHCAGKKGVSELQDRV
jgi:Zn finger protein HypA/HybF involved in hydrogenase expression